jgi:hypothetical protein
MVPAYMLSLLARQRTTLEDPQQKKFPRHWLVWEPGKWAVPKAAAETMLNLPSPEELAKAATGDCLSFGLPLKDTVAVLKVGRSETNDVVVNDATVSRQHVLLRGEPPATWWVEVSPEAKAPTRVNGKDVKPGGRAELKSGEHLELGDVALTFYDLAGLLARLA